MVTRAEMHKKMIKTVLEQLSPYIQHYSSEDQELPRKKEGGMMKKNQVIVSRKTGEKVKNKQKNLTKMNTN
jgi:hypothetical protein